MKHLIIALTVLLCSTLPVSAQEVYKEVLRLSEKTVANRELSVEVRKVAQFKVDALEYMLRKTRELMPDSNVTVLDYQAFALYDYVNLYTQQLAKNSKKKERQRIMQLFQQCSLQNARFFDTDREITMAYVNSMQHITRFSLDTDWVAALSEVRQQLYSPQKK
ncbi:MAG: hypothetical protein J6I60_00780 [Bacteroidaceae bacterium]|nr:hypothetical protein [Bacteroidaceae bacterium]